MAEAKEYPIKMSFETNVIRIHIEKSIFIVVAVNECGWGIESKRSEEKRRRRRRKSNTETEKYNNNNISQWRPQNGQKAFEWLRTCTVEYEKVAHTLDGIQNVGNESIYFIRIVCGSIESQ